MATDKRVSYEMQGHKKPARNYLGKQKTVKNIPIKWKSGPKAPATELAYITKAEKDLILKKDLHGSLKKGANTGPDGIMSLDSQGDYTRDRSPGAYSGSGGGGSPAQQSKATGTSQQALRNRAMNEKHMRSILTGQKDIGQTSAVSERTRRGAVPEYVYGPDGKPKYVGSAYKDTGKRGFLSRLFGGANKYGYGQTYGTGSGRIFDRKSSIKFNPATGRYESEDEEVGDIKPGYGGRILGGLAGLATGIPFLGPMIGGAINKFKRQPPDMSEFNTLGAAQTGAPGDSEWKGGALLDRWSQPPVSNDIVPQVKPTNIFNYKNQIPNMTDFSPRNFNVNQNYNTALNEPNSLYTMGANQNWTSQLADGGRAGYRGGELVDEDINIQGPGFDVNENMEMAEKTPFEMRIDELMDTGMSWQEAYDIASDEFNQLAEGPEESFSEEGIASIV